MKYLFSRPEISSLKALSNLKIAAALLLILTLLSIAQTSHAQGQRSTANFNDTQGNMTRHPQIHSFNVNEVILL